ncbi:MAG: transcription antitermination factor NusB [Balneolales bacterium]|nr:transcription antitermination factor NusB [Balneolales bacterium]
MSLNRRTARETVMIALYAIELSDDRVELVLSQQIHSKLKGDAKLLDFAEKLFLTTISEKKKADELISEFVKNWDVKRIAIIDRCTLRMCITEMLHFEDIPVKVTINEGIEIVKKFSTHKSGQFINGILDSVSKKLEADGLLRKSGAGLIQQSMPK